MKNGKREWRPDLKERYEQLVTSLPESGYTEVKTNSLNSSKNDGIQAHNSSMVELRRLELLTPYLQGTETLNSYLNSLKVRNCASRYIEQNRHFLTPYVTTCNHFDQESALQYLGTFYNIGANSRARY